MAKDKNDVKNAAEGHSPVLSVVRYVLGLLLFFSPFIISGLRGLSLTLPLLGLLTPPMTLVFLPPVAIGVYFVLSRKWHARLDIFLLIIAALCAAAIATAQFGGV